MLQYNNTESHFLCLLQHCTLDLGSYIKDLSVVHEDLASIVILDNSPGAYRSHPGEMTPTNMHTQYAWLVYNIKVHTVAIKHV